MSIVSENKSLKMLTFLNSFLMLIIYSESVQRNIQILQKKISGYNLYRNGMEILISFNVTHNSIFIYVFDIFV